MRKSGLESGVSDEGTFNTLAQNWTALEGDVSETTIVTGEGVDLNNAEMWNKKAKRKNISRRLNIALVVAARAKGNKEMETAYRNAFYCQSKLIGSGSRVYGKLCKSRFCTNCLAIRKAALINAYLPELEKWEDVHFVTLTVRAITAKKLNKWMKGMMRAFALIKDRCNKRHKRGKGPMLVGVKALECNFNPKRRTYNPHFHIIVPSKEIAELLIKEWLVQWTKKETSRKGQDMRPVLDLQRDLIETIKYGSKIFTEFDVRKKSQKKGTSKMYVAALDNIFTALNGTRIFERFGFNLPPKEAEEAQYKLTSNIINWEFNPSACDWVNKETGETLSGYSMPPELEFMLNYGIDEVLS